MNRVIGRNVYVGTRWVAYARLALLDAFSYYERPSNPETSMNRAPSVVSVSVLVLSSLAAGCYVRTYPASGPVVYAPPPAPPPQQPVYGAPPPAAPPPAYVEAAPPPAPEPAAEATFYPTTPPPDPIPEYQPPAPGYGYYW